MPIAYHDRFKETPAKQRGGFNFWPIDPTDSAPSDNWPWMMAIFIIWSWLGAWGAIDIVRRAIAWWGP